MGNGSMFWHFGGPTGSETAALGPYHDDGDLGIFSYAEAPVPARSKARSHSPASVTARRQPGTATVFCFQTERAKRNLPVRPASV